MEGWDGIGEMNIEELKRKITIILDQFLHEEMGNRLSQFAILALKSMILDEVNRFGKEKEDVRSEDHSTN